MKSIAKVATLLVMVMLLGALVSCASESDEGMKRSVSSDPIAYVTGGRNAIITTDTASTENVVITDYVKDTTSTTFSANTSLLNYYFETVTFPGYLQTSKNNAFKLNVGKAYATGQVIIAVSKGDTTTTKNFVSINESTISNKDIKLQTVITKHVSADSDGYVYVGSASGVNNFYVVAFFADEE